MRTSTIKSYFLEIASLLLVVLFVYAGVSKLIDFENFRVQLGQSPILGYYANWIAWAVPLLEILIAILLVKSGTRLIAFFASYMIMLLFTAYIFIILNFSDSIPCSCGGILEKMGWTEHLMFNILFVALAFAGVLFSPSATTKTTSI